MAQFAGLVKPSENPAWQYDPSFFANSINPASSDAGLNVNWHGLEDVAQSAINEYVDLASDDETDDLHEVQGHDQAFKIKDIVDTEAFADGDEDEEEGEDEEAEDDADDEGEEFVGGYAQNPDDFEDGEEVYDEEESEIEGEEFDDYDEEGEEESDGDMSNSHSLSADNASNNIKAGTGTAEDAFELSD